VDRRGSTAIKTAMNRMSLGDGYRVEYLEHPAR
jgi:hypothetical protein